jgi:hypothetical protein
MNDVNCACPSSDAYNCALVRYPSDTDPEPCECACHESEEYDDSYLDELCQACHLPWPMCKCDEGPLPTEVA